MNDYAYVLLKEGIPEAGGTKLYHIVQYLQKFNLEEVRFWFESGQCTVWRAPAYPREGRSVSEISDKVLAELTKKARK